MKLPCMQQGCKELYTINEIQQFCSAKIQKQYNVIKEDVRVGKSKKLKWCARPGCERTVTRPGCICKRRAICICGFETCFKCGDPYHEAACQVSGEAGLLVHNMNPRVAKCPNCRCSLYKIDGCNHMTCYRCNKEWCWICRRILEDHGHFEPDKIFGCNGLQFLPQSIVLWILVLTLMLIATPFALMVKFSLMLGKLCRNCFLERLMNSDAAPGAIFFFGIFLVPIVLVPTIIMLPILLIYRAYFILHIIVRHFVCCCC